MTTQEFILYNTTEEAIKEYLKENNVDFELLEVIQAGLEDDFKDFIVTLLDISNSKEGIMGGYGLFIYDHDIIKYYDKYKSTIDSYCIPLFEELEYTPDALFEKIYNKDHELYFNDIINNNQMYLKRFMVWCTVESVAHDINNILYDFAHCE